MQKFIVVATLAAACGLALAQPKDGLPVPGPVLGGSKAAAAARAPVAKPAPFKTISWDELVPKDWDPMKEFKGMDMNSMADGDPRATAMMKKLREVWDNAPTNPTLVGQAVRIPGFVVPLEETKDGVKEFLLVPYFGACVHSPPPPANQIIHVLPKDAAKVRSMDAVWISGTLATLKTDSYMGASSYRVDATAVEPYAEKPR
ncbi:MAG: DUF3299 domain-containing protein [Rubrivivax sp.]